MNIILKSIMVASLGLFCLSGCQTSGSLSDVRKPASASIKAPAQEIQKVEKADQKVETVEKTDEVTKFEVVAKKVEKIGNVLFDFKKTSVKTEYKEMLKSALGKIQDKKDVKLTLSGHTDERGSSQYNILLGQRRAYSVKLFLISLGFSKDNIKIQSYGKDKPQAAGHGEEAWKQNRRVEITMY